MSTNILRVTAVQAKMDKNGQPYKVVTFSELRELGKELMSTGNSSTRVLRPARQVEQYSFKADPYYDEVKVDAILAGSIITFDTTEYQIGNNIATTKTQVLLGEKECRNPYQTFIRLNNGQNIFPLDENGNPVAKQSTNNATASAPKIEFAGVGDEAEEGESEF